MCFVCIHVLYKVSVNSPYHCIHSVIISYYLPFYYHTFLAWYASAYHNHYLVFFILYLTSQSFSLSSFSLLTIFVLFFIQQLHILSTASGEIFIYFITCLTYLDIKCSCKKMQWLTTSFVTLLFFSSC